MGTKNFKITEGVRVGKDGGGVETKEYVTINYETGASQVLRKTENIEEEVV